MNQLHYSSYCRALGLLNWQLRANMQQAISVIIVPQTESAALNEQEQLLLVNMMKYIGLKPNNIQLVCDLKKLNSEIELCQPQVLLACGEASAQSLLKTTASLNTLREQIHHLPQNSQLPVIVACRLLTHLLQHREDKKLALTDLNLLNSTVIPHPTTC